MVDRLAGVGRGSVLDDTYLAGVGVDLDLGGGGAGRPVVEAAEGLVEGVRRAIGADALQHDVALEGATDLGEGVALVAAPDAAVGDAPVFGAAALGLAGGVGDLALQVLARGLHGGAHLNGRALGVGAAER